MSRANVGRAVEEETLEDEFERIRAGAAKALTENPLERARWYCFEADPQSLDIDVFGTASMRYVLDRYAVLEAALQVIADGTSYDPAGSIGVTARNIAKLALAEPSPTIVDRAEGAGE